MAEGTELHSCQGNVTMLCYKDSVIEPIAVPYAGWRGYAFTFQDDNARAHCVCAVQNHLQFHRIMTLPCGTFFGNVSGDGLTSHRTSASSLMHSRRNGARSPEQPFGSSSGA